MTSDNSGKNDTPPLNESVQKQMTIATSKKDEKQEMELEHDDSDSTICYDYIDQANENIQDEPVDVYKGSNVMIQKENAPSKIVTPPQTITTESRKLTLRKRTQKLQRTLLEASTIQRQNIMTTRHKNIKSNKSTKKVYQCKTK